MIPSHITKDELRRYEQTPPTWHEIASAPKDGTVVHLKRVVADRVIQEGRGLFGTMDENAPLYRDDPAWGSTPRWLHEGRQHAFPVTTHWQP